MRNPHPALLNPYKAPVRSLSLPSKQDLSRAVHQEIYEPEMESFKVATSVATEVRTEIKCGEFGYWCHDTCQRNKRCMYLSRELRLLPPGHKPSKTVLYDEAFTTGGVKCANDRCSGWRTLTSKYCSKICGIRKSSRDSYLRQKAKKSQS